MTSALAPVTGSDDTAPTPAPMDTLPVGSPAPARAPSLRYEVSKPDGTLYTESLALAVKTAKAAKRATPSARVTLNEIAELRTPVEFSAPSATVHKLPLPRHRTKRAATSIKGRK
jgi:hypothetical protein